MLFVLLRTLSIVVKINAINTILFTYYRFMAVDTQQKAVQNLMVRLAAIVRNPSHWPGVR